MNSQFASPTKMVLTCGVHREPIKGVCLFHGNCNDRLLCRTCRKVHDNPHLNFYEELEDLLNGALINDLVDELSKSIKKIDNQSFNLQRSNSAFINQVDLCFHEIMEQFTKRMLETKDLIIDKVNKKIDFNNKLRQKLIMAINDINVIYQNAVSTNFQPVYVIEDLIQILCDNVKYKSSIISETDSELQSYDYTCVNIQTIFHHAKIAQDKIIEQILEGFKVPPDRTPHKKIKPTSAEKKTEMIVEPKVEMKLTFSNNTTPVKEKNPSPIKERQQAIEKPPNVAKDSEKGPEILVVKRTILTKQSQIMFGGLASINQGKNLITAGSDGFIKFWDINNGNLLRSFKAHECDIHRIVVVQERGMMVSASSDGIIKIWNIEDINKMFKIFKGHKGPVYALEYLGDLKLIASGGEDSALRFWDVDSLKETQIITTKEGRIGSIAYFRNVKKIAVGHEKGAINVFGVTRNQNKLMYGLVGHTNYVLCLVPIEAISTLVSGSDDGSIRIWKLEEMQGTCFREMRAEGTLVRSLAVFEERDLLISTHADKMLRVWKISSGENLKSYENKHKGESILKLAERGEVVTGGKEEVTVWGFNSFVG